MCLVVSYVFVFFFKQKTAYEMRISDWSSDVCSSDLFKDVGNGPDLAGFARQVRVTTVGAAAMHDELGVDVLGRRFGEKEARNALDILWRADAQNSVVETLRDTAARKCRHCFRARACVLDVGGLSHSVGVAISVTRE